MSEKKTDTASFVLRLSQKIFETETGEPDIQWRGNIRHVQSGEETRFSNFEDAKDFVQQVLSEITLKAVEGKPEEEIKGIISKSVDFWKKVASATPKIVIDSIKDPKKQAAQFQEQIQEQIHQISDSIGNKIEETIGTKLDFGISSPKTEYKELMSYLVQMNEKITQLNQKVEEIQKNQKRKS